MRRAIFRRALVFLMCICTMLSGFSIRSYAKEDIKGYVISSNSDVETLKKVNDRIISNAKDSKVNNIYVVNVNDKINFTMANLLSLNNNGVVVGIKDNKLEEETLKTLKNGGKITVVGTKESISDELLSKDNLKFTRLENNKHVNESLGNRDLLLVDLKDDVDILGSVYYAYYYNMNLMLVDSSLGLTVENLDIIKSLGEDNGIYFYDGLSSLDSTIKNEVYKSANRDVSTISNYTLDGTDIFKIFRDRLYLHDNESKFFVAEKNSLVDMLSAYTLSERENAGFAVINGNKDLFKIENIVETGKFKELILVTSTDNSKFINFRQILGFVSGNDFAEIEVKDITGNVVSKSLIVDSKTKDSSVASEEVELKTNEIIVDGKVVNKEELQRQKEAAEVAKNQSSIKTGTEKDASGLKYKRVITMTATAYTADPRENGGYTVTKLGTPLRAGVVAVDPNVIPLGSRLYIETTDGYASYGYAVAEDTGSAIKGNKIDLFIASKAQAAAFGRRQVKVYVLD